MHLPNVFCSFACINSNLTTTLKGSYHFYAPFSAEAAEEERNESLAHSPTANKQETQETRAGLLRSLRPQPDDVSVRLHLFFSPQTYFS